MTRFPDIPVENMYFEQRRVARAVSARRKPSASTIGGLEGPFLPLVYVPGILDRMQAFGEHCRLYTSLPGRLREIAIMITARHVGAQLEFHVHAMEAREFGLAEENILAIAERRRPPSLDDEETLLYEFCTEMYTTGRISDAMFGQAVERFGKPMIVEIVATCGYYKMLGLSMNVTHPTIPDLVADFTPPFADITD